jgi:2-methylcitrate dehydratase PrpD
LAIERYGLKAKIHPCCASVHTAVDALLFLKRKYRFEAGDVESIDVLVNRVSYDNLRYPDPKTDTEARFSMQWAIALALLQDRLRLADFTPAALKRRDCAPGCRAYACATRDPARRTLPWRTAASPRSRRCC